MPRCQDSPHHHHLTPLTSADCMIFTLLAHSEKVTCVKVAVLVCKMDNNHLPGGARAWILQQRERWDPAVLEQQAAISINLRLRRARRRLTMRPQPSKPPPSLLYVPATHVLVWEQRWMNLIRLLVLGCTYPRLLEMAC